MCLFLGGIIVSGCDTNSGGSITMGVGEGTSIPNSGPVLVLNTEMNILSETTLATKLLQIDGSIERFT